MKHNIRVVSFDLDGVLYDGPSAAFPLAKSLGLGERFLEVLAKTSQRNMNFEDTIIEGARIWKGVATDNLYGHLINEIPLRSGAKETIDTLRESGYKVGCISSGVSQFFMKPFTQRLNLDFAFSNILGEESGTHSGSVEYVMGGPQKAETALKLLNEWGFQRENLASVGDGVNDIELFRISGFSIAFNPSDPHVGDAANVVVQSDDLRAILDFF